MGGTDPDGVVGGAVWTRDGSGGPTVAASRLNAGAGTWSAAQVLTPQVLEGRGASVSVGPDGEVWVAWPSVTAMGTGQQVSAARWTDMGLEAASVAASLGSNRTAATTRPRSVRVAGLPGGDAAAGWIEATPGGALSEADIAIVGMDAD